MPDVAQLEYQEGQQLTGLTLSLAGRTLLIPNTAVAELIAWQSPAALPDNVDKTSGLIGCINWRGQQLPLVSLEVLAGEAEPDVTGTTRIAIFNSLEPSGGLGFYAVLLQGIPRSVQVDEGRLHSNSRLQLRNGELMAVQLDGQDMLIPDLEGLERRLLKSGLLPHS